jgi:hypothetical protein
MYSFSLSIPFSKKINVMSQYPHLYGIPTLHIHNLQCFTSTIGCNIGLMQGESLSSFLYAMYVNDIEIELINQGCQSYELKMLNLYLLMYADDTVLFSENVHELQNMSNVVNV